MPLNGKAIQVTVLSLELSSDDACSSLSPLRSSKPLAKLPKSVSSQDDVRHAPRKERRHVAATYRRNEFT
jgi:hypothetical protein